MREVYREKRGNVRQLYRSPWTYVSMMASWMAGGKSQMLLTLVRTWRMICGADWGRGEEVSF